jgi:hypothetical protein
MDGGASFPARVEEMKLRLHPAALRPFLLPVVALALACVGCSKEGGKIEDGTDDPSYASFWEHMMKESRRPDVVIRLADAYYDSLAYEERSPHRNKVRFEFSRGFFDGFTRGITVDHPETAREHGYRAGTAMRAAHPERLKEIMEAHDCMEATAEGTWTTGFETSEFVPDGPPPGTQWWLSQLQDNVFSFMDAKDHSANDYRNFPRTRVRVKGYLSPKGGYGHLSTFKREFHAMEAKELP